MSYSIELYGEFRINKRITTELQDTVNAFFNDCGDGDMESKYPTMPSCWSPWVASEKHLKGRNDLYELNNNDEFIPWLIYLLRNYFVPNGYSLNGCVSWAGEDPNDRGKIYLASNKLRIAEYRGPTLERDEYPKDEDFKFFKDAKLIIYNSWLDSMKKKKRESDKVL